MRAPCTRLATACLIVLLASGAWAAEVEVGSVVNSEPKAQLGRRDALRDAAQGQAVPVGGELLTGAPGRLHVSFEDLSILQLGPNVELTVGNQVFTPGGAITPLTLSGGSIRVVVEKGVGCRIDTKSAIVECGGTDFVVVYDAGVTTVIGIEGNVRVGSNIPRLGGRQTVAAREMTTVRSGHAPSRPVPVDEATIRQYLGGFQFIGHGRLESTTVDHPVLVGEPLAGDSAPPPGSWGRVALDQPPYEVHGPGDKVKPPFAPRGNLGIGF